MRRRKFHSSNLLLDRDRLDLVDELFSQIRAVRRRELPDVGPILCNHSISFMIHRNAVLNPRRTFSTAPSSDDLEGESNDRVGPLPQAPVGTTDRFSFDNACGVNGGKSFGCKVTGGTP